MKKILLSLFLLFAMISSFAQSLTISSNTNVRFWLFVDNVLQNGYSVSSICVQRIPFGDHSVRVELDNQNKNCFGQQIMIDRDRIDYSIVYDKGLFGLQWGQTASRPEYVMDFIMPNDNLYSYFEDYSYHDSYGVNNNYSTHGSIYGGHGNHGNHGNNQHPNVTPPVVANPCMNPRDFAKAMQMIHDESFDDEKLRIAQQVALDNNLCVGQIVEVCRLMTFEKNKLEFAKYAYASCADQQNYFQVNEVFDQESSKRDLDRFIKGL